MGVDPVSLGLEGAAVDSAAGGGAKAAPALAGGAKGAETAAGAGAGLAGAGADVLGPAAGALSGAAGLVPGSLDALSATGNLAGTLAPGVTGAGDVAATAAPALAVPAEVSPGTVSASGFSAPAGVTPALGTDPTAALGAGDATLPANATPAAFSPEGVATGNPVATAGAGLGTDATGLSAPNAAAASGGSFLDKLGMGAVNSVTKNPLGLALAAGGTGFNILEGQKNSALQNQLAAQAGQQSATGSQLEGYLTSGTLPPGLQASVTTAVADAKAKAISNMASQGLSTDPTKNTALAAELASIDQQVPVLTAQIGQQLMTSGEQASGLSSNIYTTLANIDQTQTANIGKSIAAMAAALSGKTQVPGTNISVSQG